VAPTKVPKPKTKAMQRPAQMHQIIGEVFSLFSENAFLKALAQRIAGFFSEKSRREEAAMRATPPDPSANPTNAAFLVTVITSIPTTFQFPAAKKAKTIAPNGIPK
jgi:hypothetical protein